MFKILAPRLRALSAYPHVFDINIDNQEARPNEIYNTR